MLFANILSFALFVFSVLAANRADFKAPAKFKKGMQPGHVYTLETGSRVGNQRLVIVRITGTAVYSRLI